MSQPRFGEGDCKICGRAPDSPYRRYDANGRNVVEGCVDDAHTGHVYAASLRWHNRPEAKKIRAGLRGLRHLKKGRTRPKVRRHRKAGY